MTDIDPPPRAVRPFIAFVALMRANGFVVAPEQTTSFLSAIVLLGPRGPEDIRRAGLATLAPPPERHAAYHALFDMHFLGADGPDFGEGEDDDAVRLQEERPGAGEPVEGDESNESGEAATSRRGAGRAPFWASRRERSATAPQPRGRPAPAAAAGLSPPSRAAGRRGRPAPHLARRDAQ